MASQSLHHETQTQLNALVNKWSARWRLRRIVLYMPRIVMLTVLVGIITSLIIAYLRGINVTGMLIVTSIAMSTTFVLITSALGLFSKRGYEAVRQFEILFGLQERISTALELIDGRINTTPDIAQRQIEDAYKVAQTVDPRKQIPLKIRWLEWLGAVLLILVLIVALVFSAYTLYATSEGVSAQTQQAITGAAATTRDITENLATDSALTDEERSALLESAEVTLDELENPDLSAEESFVSMSDLESDIREQVEALREELADAESGLNNAAEALNNPDAQTPGDSEELEPGQSPADSLADVIQEQSEDAPGMSEQQQQELAQQLQEAADAVRENNPELADALEDAAQALEEGNQQEFQSAMEAAAQQSQSAGQQNQARQQSADALQQAADQAQQAAQNIAQSEQQSAQQQQDGQQQDGQQQGEQQSGQQGQEPGESEESGQQQGQGQDASSETASEGGAQVQSQQGQAPGQQPGENSPQQGQQSSESEDGGGSGGAGDGDGPDQQGVQAIGDAPQAADTDNNGGESEFDSVFAPELSNIQQGDTDIILDTNSTNDQTREGDFSDNPDGESTVPYNQVFSSYADAASSALENGYVPLGVRDVVRDYFTSLEPTGRTNAGDR